MYGLASQLWAGRSQGQVTVPLAWRAARTGCQGSRILPLPSAVFAWGPLASATRTCAQSHIATCASCGLQVSQPLPGTTVPRSPDQHGHREGSWVGRVALTLDPVLRCTGPSTSLLACFQALCRMPRTSSWEHLAESYRDP